MARTFNQCPQDQPSPLPSSSSAERAKKAPRSPSPSHLGAIAVPTASHPTCRAKPTISEPLAIGPNDPTLRLQLWTSSAKNLCIWGIRWHCSINTAQFDSSSVPFRTSALPGCWPTGPGPAPMVPILSTSTRIADMRFDATLGPMYSKLQHRLQIYAVVDDDGHVITAGHRFKRIRRP
jgi:hypothetical protein